MEQRRHDPQIAGHRGLAGQQRKHALVYLEIAPVDPIVVAHDHSGQLDVLVGDRLKRSVELRDDQVHAAQRLFLQPLQLFAELVSCLVGHQLTRTFR